MTARTPLDTLAVAGGSLYGTTVQGGVAHNGSIFVLQTNGAGFAILHSFASLTLDTAPSQNGGNEYDDYYTNSDGHWPEAGLILSGDTLYGTAQYGGAGGNGTVFKINTNGSGSKPSKHFRPWTIPRHKRRRRQSLCRFPREHR
jgi:uncharacterized repeat protein (TIGR03803 family)